VDANLNEHKVRAIMWSVALCSMCWNGI